MKKKVLSKPALVPYSYTEALNDKPIGRFSAANLHSVEKFSKSGITADDIAVYYGLLSYSDLTPQEAEWFDLAYRRGKIQGKEQAMRALFAQMDGKDGTTAAIEYLKHYNEDWRQETTTNGTNSQLPVIFNIGKDYDAKMVKPPIIPLLDEDE